MLNTIPARNLQKFYKSILENVKTTKRVVLLTTNDKPQAALVSLEDLDILNRAKNKKNALNMLSLAKESKKELKTLSADLRKKANAILYTQ